MGQTDSEDMVRALTPHKKTGSQELRDQLAVHYLPIVHSVAIQPRAVAGSFLGQEDLANQDVLALTEYLNRYDPDRGARFGTYAFIRVRGSMIDYIHNQDWVPHRVGNFQKKASQAFPILSHEKTRELDIKKVIGYLNLPVEKVEDHIRYVNHTVVLPFEPMLQGMTVVFVEGELEAKGMDGKPEESFYYREFMEVPTTVINGLGEKERLAIALYYYEKLKCSEIAEVMGVGQSRVCQIHTRAIGKPENCLEGHMRG